MLDVEIHLDAKGLTNTIKEMNEESKQDETKVMIFLHYYFHEGLKTEYLTLKDPVDIWKSLKDVTT